MQLTLKQVRYFLAAAETRQFSLAAARACVTQTAITAAIRDLEEGLGMQLFERHHASGVSLTAEGERFLLHAQNIMTAVNGALSSPTLADPKKTVGHLRVGATHIMLGHYIVPAMARFTNAYPHITVDLIENTRPRIEEALVYGELDAGVLWANNVENVQALELVSVATSRRQLWTAADHPLLRQRNLSLHDLKDEPYGLVDIDEVAKNTMAFWALHGLTPNVCFKTSSLEAVRSMVALNKCITILGDVAYRPWSREGLRVEARPLSDGLPTIEIALVMKRDEQPSPALKALKAFLRLAISIDTSREGLMPS